MCVCEQFCEFWQMQSCYHHDNPKRNGSFRKPCFDKAISLPVATLFLLKSFLNMKLR